MSEQEAACLEVARNGRFCDGAEAYMERIANLHQRLEDETCRLNNRIAELEAVLNEVLPFLDEALPIDYATGQKIRAALEREK